MSDDLDQLAARVVDLCRSRELTIAVAESCTGGMVMAVLTSVPGASDIFQGGVVAYANETKTGVLGVSEDLLATFGAVSKAAAWAMARGVRAQTDVDLAVSVTGVAGPGGGTGAKPVGTVIFGRVSRHDAEDEAFTVRADFDPALGREGIRRQAARMALELLLEGAAPPSP